MFMRIEAMVPLNTPGQRGDISAKLTIDEDEGFFQITCYNKTRAEQLLELIRTNNLKVTIEKDES